MRKTFLGMSAPSEPGDLIPIQPALAVELRKYFGCSKQDSADTKAVYSVWQQAAKNGYTTRASAKRALSYRDYPDFQGLDCFKARVADESIMWERIEKITPAGRREVFDLAVPRTKIFAVNDGLVIYDTMNFHVPKSKDAVKEAFELLLPSKSLIQPADMKSAMPRMISEGAGGLYLASLPPDKKQQPRIFMTWRDVEHAYDRGEIALDDAVIVAGG